MPGTRPDETGNCESRDGAYHAFRLVTGDSTHMSAPDGRQSTARCSYRSSGEKFRPYSAIGVGLDDTTADLIDATLDLDPTSAQSVASTDVDYDWMVSFDIVLTERGGSIGADIDTISLEVEESQNGIALGERAGDRWRLALDAPSSRLDAGGALTIGAEVFYALETGGREALIDVNVVAFDDDGFPLVGSATFEALP